MKYWTIHIRIYLTFLSREIDIQLCQIYTKFHIYAILYKSCSIHRSYSTNMQPIWKRRYPTGAWKSHVCSYYIFWFLFCIFYNIIDNVITHSLYNVTRTSANDSSGSLSRDTDGNLVTSILHCHWLKFCWRNTDYTDYIK